MLLYFSNKASSAISSFTTTLDVPAADKAKLTYDVKGLPDSTLQEGAQAQQMIMFEARAPFAKPPTIRISYLAGALQALTLALPLTVHKFMEAAALSPEDFFRRWKQIGAAPREAQQVFGVKARGEGRFEAQGVRRVVEGFKWGVLDGVDPNAKNIVGASVLHTSEAGKVGCLLRLEPNYETQVCSIFHFPSRISNSHFFPTPHFCFFHHGCPLTMTSSTPPHLHPQKYQKKTKHSFIPTPPPITPKASNTQLTPAPRCSA